MDERDARLLAALHEDPLASYESLGKTLGISGVAVRRRHDRLHGAGILQGVAVMPQPVCFGRRQTILHYRPSDDEPPSIETLLDLPEVCIVKRAHDGGTTLIAAASGDARELEQEATAVFGRDPRSRSQPDPASRSTDHALSSIEWRLLRAWVAAPRTTLNQLARSAGLAPKTARLRRRSLLDRHLVQVSPLVDATRTQGVIFYGLALHAADPEALEAAIRVLRQDGHFVASAHPSPATAYLWGHAANYPDLTQRETEVGRMAGIERVHLSVPAGMAFHRDRVLGWIDEALEGWNTTKRSI